MKGLKLNFTWKGQKKIWYPLQTVTSLIIIGLIIIGPFIVRKTINHIATNYVVDDKGTLNIYDDTFVRIEQ